MNEKLLEEATALALSHNWQDVESDDFDIDVTMLSRDMRLATADAYFERLLGAFLRSEATKSNDQIYLCRYGHPRDSKKILRYLFNSAKEIVTTDTEFVPHCWASSGTWKVSIRDEYVVNITDELCYDSDESNNWVESDSCYSALQSMSETISNILKSAK